MVTSIDLIWYTVAHLATALLFLVAVILIAYGVLTISGVSEIRGSSEENEKLRDKGYKKGLVCAGIGVVLLSCTLSSPTNSKLLLAEHYVAKNHYDSIMANNEDYKNKAHKEDAVKELVYYIAKKI
ncbi:MAG: hypothetical protein ACRDD8_15985 [Bacteroidales bacterium]